MSDALLWLVVVEAVGLITFPLAYALFPFLYDRGYGLSKPLGILVLAYTLWLSGSAGVLPATRWSAVAVLGALTIASTALLRTRWRGLVDHVHERGATLLLIEGVFIGLYLAWVAYRAYDPAIDSTEKPMDFAFLNASIRAQSFPAEDPWLAGNPISYYYLGYLMMGTLTELVGILPQVAYNLSLALIPGLAGAAVFSLVVSLVRGAGEGSSTQDAAGVETDRPAGDPGDDPTGDTQRQTGRPSRGVAWAVGLLAVVLLVVSSNQLGVFELVRARGVGTGAFWEWVGVKDLTAPPSVEGWVPREFWWWWRSSRVIDTLKDGESQDYTINEFPLFSLLLGDLHPHLMSIPWMLLVLGFCLHLWRDPTMTTHPYSRRRLPFLLAFSISLGALGFINTWDLPTFMMLAAGVIVLRFLHASPDAPLPRAILRSLPIVGGLLPLAWLLYAPFYSHFSSQAGGILPVFGPVSRYVHLLLIWALFMVPLVGMVGHHLWTVLRQERRLTAHAWLAFAIVAAPYALWALAALLVAEPGESIAGRFVHLIPFSLFTWAALYGLLEGTRHGSPASLLFSLTLAFVGGMLLMGPELFYVIDMFDSRMNTVFKLHYQAWTILAPATAFALYYWHRRVQGFRRLVKPMPMTGLVLFGILLLGSLYYPVTATFSKADGFQGPATLNGLAYVKSAVPGEYAAIRWLQEHAGADSRIVEAVGGDYTAYGRIAASTGLPTLLNWPGHEVQWRGSTKAMDGRREAIDRIYSIPDPREAQRILNQYDVDYVIVGPREINTYGQQGIAKFAGFMDRVCCQERGFSIYAQRDGNGTG